MADITYVGWGGASSRLEPDFDMGRGKRRGGKRYGLRRAVWDAAFGYVSGFPKRDILYFVLTRSLSRKVCDFVLRHEGIQFRDGIPVAAAVKHGFKLWPAPVTPTENGENR